MADHLRMTGPLKMLRCPLGPLAPVKLFLNYFFCSTNIVFFFLQLDCMRTKYEPRWRRTATSPHQNGGNSSSSSRGSRPTRLEPQVCFLSFFHILRMLFQDRLQPPPQNLHTVALGMFSYVFPLSSTNSVFSFSLLYTHDKPWWHQGLKGRAGKGDEGRGLRCIWWRTIEWPYLYIFFLHFSCYFCSTFFTSKIVIYFLLNLWMALA